LFFIRSPWLSEFRGRKLSSHDFAQLKPKSPRNAPTVTGKAALKAWGVQLFADPNFAGTFQSTRVVASKGGDMVFSEGTYTVTLTNPKTKKPITNKGKYLTVYMKQPDASWKAVADTYNSDSPM
jgi:ketosteroid isomerase-like protein